MTFEEYWPTACLPGEYDSMDSCDQGRWRGVAQAAYQAGQADAREDLTIAYMTGYSKGRDAMKAECVKVCEEQYEYYGYDHIFAKKIKELK